MREGFPCNEKLCNMTNMEDSIILDGFVLMNEFFNTGAIICTYPAAHQQVSAVKTVPLLFIILWSSIFLNVFEKLLLPVPLTLRKVFPV